MTFLKILRASLLHTLPDPRTVPPYRLEYRADAAVLIDDSGFIVETGEALDLLRRWPDTPVDDARPYLMVAGFVDTHIHFPQMDMIGACASSLLPWLQNYTFPEEERFRGDGRVLLEQARAFSLELARQGTTLAVVYSSSDYEASEQLFQAFFERGLRGIIGKVSMDIHAPASLLVEAKRDLRETEQLIADWHKKRGRLYYALTPRFAPNCSDALLRGLASLGLSDPSLYIQTHFAENLDEIAWVRQLFPQARDYLDVYDHYQLLGPKTILAHCIHTLDRERQLLRDKKVVVSHCPTSNLFLGSGLMPYLQYRSQGLSLSLGTDVGAGTSFSLWQTMSEAYKVAQIRGEPIETAELFYAATLGGALALGFSQIGALAAGYAADIQLLDPSAKDVLWRRWQRCQSAEERLNALIFNADDRIVRRLFVAGQEVALLSGAMVGSRDNV